MDRRDGRPGVALATSGSAVLFAAITVCLALCGLALVRIPYVTTLGFSAALFVVVTVVAALTLLPAMLGRARPPRDLRLVVAPPPAAGAADGPTLSARWAAQMARRPIVFCLVSLAMLLALASPLFGIELGFPSDASAPTVDHPAPGLRPHRPGLRPGRQRAAARGRQPAPARPRPIRPCRPT